MTRSMILPQSTGNSDSFNTGSISPKAADQIVQWAKSEFTKMKNARVEAQRQWYYNLSMYYGKQYYDIVNMRNGDRLLKTPPAPRYRTRHTVNLIRSMIRAEIARMTSTKPTATVTPATTSTDDMFAAQAAEQVWEFLQQRRDYHYKMMRNAFWISIVGTGFMKTWWDNDYSKNTALLALSNAPAVGDVLFDVVTPFNLFVPDLMEVDIEGEPYVFEAYTRQVSWVKKFWPQLGDVRPNVVARNEIIETTYFNVQGGEQTTPDSVLVLECWVKPGGSNLLPDGGMFTIIGDKLAQAPSPGMPYTHGEFPYTKFEHIPTGKFYGDSVLVDINPLQREYNRTRSHIIESKNLMARPQLLVAEGSMDTSKHTAEPGQHVIYKMGFPPPTPLQIQPLPAYVLQEQDRIKGDMEDISGQHSVSRGQVPGGGVTAATAISFLQEQDDSIMGPTYASIERGTEKIARQALVLVVDNYELPRIIETTGINQSFDSLELKGSDIERGINLRIEGGSALPQSKSARQALVLDFFKLGAISAEDMMDMLDIGGVSNITEKIRIDKKQAQRENLRMKKLSPQDIQAHEFKMMTIAQTGGPGAYDPNSGAPLVMADTPGTFPPVVEVNDYDNHIIHIQTHNDYRKSQEFETLDDEVKHQFELHVQGHKQAMMTQMMTNNGQMIPPELTQQTQQIQQPDQGAPVNGQPQPASGQ